MINDGEDTEIESDIDNNYETINPLVLGSESIEKEKEDNDQNSTVEGDSYSQSLTDTSDESAKLFTSRSL